MDKGVFRSGERIEEAVLHWFSHMERKENGRIAKRVYVGKYADSRSERASRGRKRWIDTVKDCSKKRELWMSGKQGE